MRTLVNAVALLSIFIAISVPAYAQRLAIIEAKPNYYDAYASQLIDQPWPTQRAHPQLIERPFVELLSKRLGIAQGRAELFRFQIKNAPSSGTMLNGSVDGVGIKLRVTW